MAQRGRTGRRLASLLLGVTTGAAAVGPVAFAAPADTASTKASASHKTRHHWRFDPSTTTMAEVSAIIGADRVRRGGTDGSGVGVALIDTGLAPVAGLAGTRVVEGPDLSLDSQVPSLTHRDTFGHGTHLAGIIAGTPAADRSGFTGVAPGATLTSVKVGAGAGITDVSQVIAAIDWVVAHRNDDPAHPTRVLNLSYNTDGIQDHRLDPLTHAVENAWRAGIVVVVAAGNGGSSARLSNPAYDPFVLAIGAADPVGTATPADDQVTDFSSRGDSTRRVDLIAPGRSVVSLRDPGSYIDELYPEARVGTQYTKGSGTSQAAAVVSGAVALLLQQRPGLTPDQVKQVLTDSAARLPRADRAGTGAGELDIWRATRTAAKASAVQTWDRSTGRGSLEAARGTAHIAIDGVALTGERHLLGDFDAAAWSARSSAGTAWDGGRWMGHQYTTDGWGTAADSPWSGLSWSGLSWSGLSWSGLSWSGLSWSGLSWSGLSWSGLSWSGLSWSGLSWSGLSWSGLSWSTGVWA
jgi:serine protease AprX